MSGRERLPEEMTPGWMAEEEPSTGQAKMGRKSMAGRENMMGKALGQEKAPTFQALKGL